jgi:hypothetical protein
MSPESETIPTRPGVYWYQPETMLRALMVEVRLTDGQLTVWWPNQDQPVAKLKGTWRGPIPPSSGPDGLVPIFLGHQADPGNGTLDGFL